MRLPRVIEGPWAWMACGALTLLGIATVANLPAALRGFVSRPAEQAAAPVNWIADPSQYPPALLRVPGKVSPAELGDSAVMTRLDNFARERGPSSRAAGFSEREQPAEPETQTVLRRLPEVEDLKPPESEPTVDQLIDERLPEFGLPVTPGRNSYPKTVDSPVSPELDLHRPDTASPPSTGGAFQPETPVVEMAAPHRAQPVLLPPIESAPRVAANRPVANRQPANPQALQAVSERANELSRHGFSLAQRGAFYSARAEFVQSLRLITQALDAQRPDAFHSQSLAAGLLAMQEADDFVPRGSQLEANLNVVSVVVTHQTPVLKNATQVSPLAAVQKYYGYAQEQLAHAGGGQPAASAALYGLGRVHLALSNESVDARRLGGPKALTLHQAALLVHARNHRAANELGVLLARYGQLKEAKRVLLMGLSSSRQREAWHNLAVVHERLGEAELAKKARYEAQLLATGKNTGPESDSLVRWVGVKEFSASSNNADSAAPVLSTNGTSAPRTAVAPKHSVQKSSYLPWPWK